MSENNFVVQWEEFTPRWFVEGIDNVIDNIYVDIFAGIPMYDPDGTESVSLSAGGAVYQKGTNKICVAKSNITLTPPDSVPSSSNSNFYVYTIKEYIDTKVSKTTTVNGHPLSDNVTVTKADVGLGNADNTSDVNKPVSTAQQEALDLKAPKASPEFTGNVSLGRSGQSGTGSIAIGVYAEASGNYSSAFGNNVKASGDYSSATGRIAHATGDNSHAEGYNTGANGSCSHAENSNTIAEGSYSHAEGLATRALRRSQHVFGEYNTMEGTLDDTTEQYESKGTYVEIVGNGTANTTAGRSTARTLDWNGNERIMGDLYFGCNADSTGGTKLGDALALKAPLASPVLTGTPKSVTPTSSSNEKMIATKEYVDNAFTTFDAMLYKGVVNQNSDLPATHKRGWTYKVGTAGTYVGIVCEVGDMIVCNTGGTSANNSHWNVIQTNIDGAVIGPASSTTNHVALFNGATGKVIKDGGTIQSLIIDDTAGNGNTDKTWSADKIYDQLALKAPKASPVFTGSISLGRKSGSTVGNKSFAVGEDVVASGANSHAEGESHPGIGVVPTAYTTASGQGSHAEGGGTTASGLYSHAEGERSSATAEASHAEGTSTASGVLSHAEGTSIASGLNAHAEGYNTEAGGSFSHAENWGNFAIGDCSHAEGRGTLVKRYAQHSFGTYNVTDETGVDKSAKGKYIEIVGNGERVNAKSNARTLDWNGNERLKGNLYVGCNADSTGGSKVLAVSDFASSLEVSAIISEYGT